MSANGKALEKCMDLLYNELLNSCHTKAPINLFLKFGDKELKYLGSIYAKTAIRGDKRVGFFSLSFMSVCCALCENYTIALQMYKFFRTYWTSYDLQFDISGSFTYKTLASEYERQKGCLKFSVKPELQASRAKFVQDVSSFQEETKSQVEDFIMKHAETMHLF